MKKLNLTLVLLATTTAFASGAFFDSEQVAYLYTDEPCPKVVQFVEYQPFEPFDYPRDDQNSYASRFNEYIDTNANVKLFLKTFYKTTVSLLTLQGARLAYDCIVNALTRYTLGFFK